MPLSSARSALGRPPKTSESAITEGAHYTHGVMTYDGVSHASPSTILAAKGQLPLAESRLARASVGTAPLEQDPMFGFVTDDSGSTAGAKASKN